MTGITKIGEDEAPLPDESWTIFYAEFTASDPEPPLWLTEPDDFNHYKNNGKILIGGMHYPTAQVDAHVAWLDRLAKAYVEFLRRPIHAETSEDNAG